VDLPGASPAAGKDGGVTWADVGWLAAVWRDRHPAGQDVHELVVVQAPPGRARRSTAGRIRLGQAEHRECGTGDVPVFRQIQKGRPNGTRETLACGEVSVGGSEDPPSGLVGHSPQGADHG
jgi:hypothetical protein